MELTSTYSPEDNKLRLYSATRLDTETYKRVREAGFIRAPKQDLFVAPTWTPGREDLLLELCGEIGDEDTSLVDRAAGRAERFSDYQESRAEDATRAQEYVSSITDGIPMGQPILVGHHSEKHARKDAERIENGMRRAVKMWETSEYWKRRAQGALSHARYKELPAVRLRRIKGLEADLRKEEKTRDEKAKFLKTYRDPEAMTVKLRDGRCLIPALLGTYEGGLSFEDQTKLDKGLLSFVEALEKATRNLTAIVANTERWIIHLTNRIEYERAMLGEGDAVDADILAGGEVQVRGAEGWHRVVRVTRCGGKTHLVEIAGRRDSFGASDVTGYNPPTAEQSAEMKAAVGLPPLCNYPGPGFTP